MGPIDSHRAGQERTDMILHLLTALGLKAATTFADHGNTREPWEGQKPRQKGTVIDFILTSKHLQTFLEPTLQPNPTTTADHKPLGAAVLAPPRRKKARRLLLEGAPAPEPDWSKTLPAKWVPTNMMAFRAKLARITISSLDVLAPEIVTAGKSLALLETERNKEKQRLRICIRSAPEPIIKRAYQIRLRITYCREQRENEERRTILSWAKGEKWGFTRDNRYSKTTHLPRSLNGEEDRGKWGSVIGRHL